MKNFTLIFCFIIGTIIILPAKGQTTSLEFNQVILVSTVQTVPTGKVWKIESVTGNSTVVPSQPADNAMNTIVRNILINGNTITVYAAGYAHQRGTNGSGYSSYTSDAFITSGRIDVNDLWLPAGATLAISTNVTYISVIEFNVSP